MPFLLFGGAVLGILLFSAKKTGVFDMSQRLYDLDDVDPMNQGGGYKRDYDLIFETVANETGVPFALLKAHAIMESSLNPRAFRDENPSKRTDRVGWASRGLMQVLFWPKSTRFEQFGYTAKDLQDGEKLFDPYTNVRVAAALISANLKAVGGNLRDSINMYNAGVKESVRVAPHNYTDKVQNYYLKILGKVA